MAAEQQRAGPVISPVTAAILGTGAACITITSSVLMGLNALIGSHLAPVTEVLAAMRAEDRRLSSDIQAIGAQLNTLRIQNAVLEERIRSAMRGTH